MSADYRRRHLDISPDRIVLTASTSEAYAWLFKLCCRPTDDEVLIPAPSYPLFDHLTRMDGVSAVPYRLEYHGRWALDSPSLDEAWSDEVRAVLVVSPNNPTGSVLGARRNCRRSAIAAPSCDAVLIVDEVFADYPLRPRRRDGAADAGACLSVRLGGLSKSAGLPQVKLGWMAFDGPEAHVADAMEQAGADCRHLPVGLDAGAGGRAGADRIAARRCAGRFVARVRRNDAAIRAAAAHVTPAVDVLTADGGWSAVLRVPADRPEEELVADAARAATTSSCTPATSSTSPHGCHLIVSLLRRPTRSTPASGGCWTASMADAARGRFADGRHAGVIAPLFSIPSAASWGIGEIPDLPLLARWLEAAGLDFIQLLPINEMHAGQSSPYSGAECDGDRSDLHCRRAMRGLPGRRGARGE